MMVWTAYVRQDGDDVVLPLPDDLLDQLKWKEGDVLVWDIQDDGSVVLRKKTAWYDVLWSRIRSWRNK